MIEQIRKTERSVAAWAVRNPYAIFAAFLAIVIGALAAVLFLLPTRMMPYVQSPLISVVTMTPGYSPREVETYFTKPIEERMTDLQGVRYIRSYSQQGVSIITLEFNYGADMQRALVDTQQLAKQAEGDLPYDRANLKPSYVVPVDPLNTPILQFAITAKNWDPVQLRQFVANQVVRELKGVPGVQVVFPFGGLQRQIRVDANRDALASNRLSVLDVRDALDAQNLSRSAGVVTGGGYETLVRGDQRAQSAASIANYPVFTRDGRTVYVRDVASVTDGPAEVRSTYRFNGESAVELSVVENPDASSPRVIAAVMQRVEQIEANHPGLRFARAYDNSRFVNDLTRNMLEELIISVLLAGLVLLVFLEDVSATFIVITSIPTCLSLAVLLFVPMNFSINSSTLIGLLLAIGRLVDDSIVVIHSVHRKLDEGASPVRAAIDGTMEVIVPIAAATGVMALAVVPLLMSGGITQIMFTGLVWPIVFALLASLLVSVTLTPLLAALLFQPKEVRAPVRTHLDRVITYALRPARRALKRLESAYRSGLAWSLDNRTAVLAGAALLTYAGISLLPFIGREMMPLADTGQAYALLEMDPGTSFGATNTAAKRFESLLLHDRDVEKVSASVGEESGSDYFTGQPMNGVNDASYLITFKPKEERQRSIWQILDAVYARATQTIPGIRRLALKEMGADVMASNAAPVEILLYGPDKRELYHLAQTVAASARTIPGLYEVSTSSSYTQPEADIVVDRTRASHIGLTPQAVQMQAYYALHGGLTAEYFNPENLRHDSILVRYAQDERDRTGDIRNVQIVGTDGQVVPLRALARVDRSTGPSLVEHDGLRPSVSVLAFYRRGGPSEMNLDMRIIMRGMAATAFPRGYGMEMRGDMTQMMQSFNRLLSAMAVAIVFVFLLLVAQFRSVVQPLVMLLAIPLQLLGMFGALLLTHQSFSTVSILGIVVANGMAVSNAILLLDLIIRKRKEGMTRREAILYAGPVRLHPILMTTIVSLIVLVPVAFFPKTGIDAYAPLATVIIGGLSLSTLLTLFVVPVLHDALDDLPVRWPRGAMRSAGILLIAVLLTQGHLFAQPLQWNGEMTQDQAAARARQSFTARLAQIDATIAAAQARFARAQTLPRLSLSESYANGSRERLGMPTPFQRYASLDLSAPIFDPQLWDMARAAGLQSQAASANAAMQVNDAVAHAIQQYDAAALAAGIVEQRAADVRDEQAHLFQTQQRVRAGAAPRYLVSRDRAALAHAQQSQEDAKADAAHALHALEVGLDLDVRSAPALRLTPPEPLETDESALLTRAQSRRPDVIAARQIVLSWQQRVARARAAYLPVVSITAQAFTGTSNPEMGTSGTQIGATASLPLFDGASRNADLRIAQADSERAQVLLEQTQLRAQAEVLDALRDLQAAKHNLQSAQAALTDAQISARIAQLRERAGKGINLETLDALAVLAGAREDVLRAAARYNDAAAALHRSVGDYV